MSNNSQGRRTKTGEEAFQQMEDRIASIHYFFRNADLTDEVRQVMTYRKLMALDYFTPKAAQALLRQWNQADQPGAEVSPQPSPPARPPRSRTTRPAPMGSIPRSRTPLSSGFRSTLGSRSPRSTTARSTTGGAPQPVSAPSPQNPDPQAIKALSAQLSTAVAQQQWEQAIRILDEMIPWVPHQQVELSTYRDTLSALAGSTP